MWQKHGMLRMPAMPAIVTRFALGSNVIHEQEKKSSPINKRFQSIVNDEPVSDFCFVCLFFFCLLTPYSRSIAMNWKTEIYFTARCLRQTIGIVR